VVVPQAEPRNDPDTMYPEAKPFRNRHQEAAFALGKKHIKLSLLKPKIRVRVDGGFSTHPPRCTPPRITVCPLC